MAIESDGEQQQRSKQLYAADGCQDGADEPDPYGFDETDQMQTRLKCEIQADTLLFLDAALPSACILKSSVPPTYSSPLRTCIRQSSLSLVYSRFSITSPVESEFFFTSKTHTAPGLHTAF